MRAPRPIAIAGHGQAAHLRRAPLRRCRRARSLRRASALSSRSRSRPAATPARSAALRFWLTFHLPTSELSVISMPTIAPQHRLDEVGRRVGHRPGRGAAAFVAVGQARHEGAQPGAVVDRAQPAARLHHHVVPGRHDLAVLGLARVPGRRDVAVRALEDDEGIDVVARLRPERVGARDVGAQHAGRASRSASRKNGTLLASMPPARFCVTSSPSGWAAMNARSTCGRDSRNGREGTSAGSDEARPQYAGVYL